MTLNELRSKYLNFMLSRGHKIIPSSSLIPQNDPTTLFTSSGMQPIITYLLGEVHPEGKRIADSQKCFRAEDIDEVGDNRHTTFFEMLGNWSLGDYFKKEQLEWLFEFVIEELKLDPQRLYVSVYSGDSSQTLITQSGEEPLSHDQQSIEILQSLYSRYNIKADYKSFGSVDEGASQGMGTARIFGYDKKNWWSRAGTPDKMPSGEPGGPDAELFYDFGTQHDPQYGQYCHPNCDCGRFMEIGNSVFMQYRKTQDGRLEQLPNKNIDFGGGLERLLSAIENKDDIFLTDSHYPIISKLEQLSGKTYHDKSLTKHFRIIADHLKAAVMLASDGVTPSNKMQGYMVRRLIRRSVASANALALPNGFTSQIIETVAKMYSNQYPEVLNEQIVTIISDEENKFRNTLEKGISELNRRIQKIKHHSPENEAYLAFDMYQSHGLPVDVTLDQIEHATKRVYNLEHRQETIEIFNKLTRAHQQLSRTSSAGVFKGGLAEHSEITTQYHTATHLLHQALRDVLGSQVAQRGSNITAERLRFDFSCQERPTPEQIQQVEEIVNAKIKESLPVYMQQMSKEEAFASGAIGLFGEKYPDTVNIYTIGPNPKNNEIVDRRDVFSREFCGGPHVTNTSQISGHFKISKTEKISKDTSRINAILFCDKK